jgi:hypothetical protein
MQTDGQDESLEQTAAGAFVAVFSFRVTDFPSFAHLLPFVARTRDRRRADSTRSASHERAGEALRAAAGQRHARALARLDRLSTPPLDPRRLERAAFRPPNTGQTCTATNAVLELRLAVARRYAQTYGCINWRRAVVEEGDCLIIADCEADCLCCSTTTRLLGHHADPI